MFSLIPHKHHSFDRLFHILFIFGLVFLTIGCKDTLIVDGLSPIYLDPDDFSLIESVEPKELEDLKSFVQVGNLLFALNNKKGIHVFDNTDPTQPKNIRFWYIPGCNQFTFVDGYLYAGNSVHLLIIEIVSLENIKVIDHIADFYVEEEMISIDRPPSEYTGYFYCVDQSKGVAVDWEEKKLIDPHCEAF